MRAFGELVSEAGAADVTGWGFGRRDGPFVAHSTRHLIEARR